jgi:hypothetical protein
MTNLLWAIVILGGGAWFVVNYWKLPDLTPTRKVDEKVTLSVLRSEALVFLVTRRTVTQVVIDYRETSWVSAWRCVLWGVIRFSWGADLKKIREQDIRQEGGVVYVKLPEPELLEFSVEPGSIDYIDKSTAAAKLDDLLNNTHRQELERRLYAQALDFASHHGLIPTRAELISLLNESTLLLKGRAGFELRFE